MKHNKKRNSAFLYEALTREATRATLQKDSEKVKLITQLIKESFRSDTEMGKELRLYRELEKDTVDEDIADKFLIEVKNRHDKLDKKKIFVEQSNIISVINKKLGVSVYNNFIPSYKQIATISQIFSDSTGVKEKILLESSIIDFIKKKDVVTEQKSLKPIDNLVYNTFAKKFNEKYSSLLSEQKQMLTNYVGSFADEGLQFKAYLNEEIGRMKKEIQTIKTFDVIASDALLTEKSEKLLEYLNGFNKVREVKEDTLQKLMKIQQFIHEVKN